MAARAVEMDRGYRPRGERCYRTKDGLTHLNCPLTVLLLSYSWPCGKISNN